MPSQVFGVFCAYVKFESVYFLKQTNKKTLCISPELWLFSGVLACFL